MVEAAGAPDPRAQEAQIAELEAQAQAKAQAGPKKKGGGKGKLILVLLVMLLGGGAAAAYFTGLIPGKGKEEKKKEVEEHVELTPSYEFAEFVLNLADEGEVRYAKISIAIAVDSEATMEEVEESQAYFKDVIVEEISSSTSEQLATKKGREALRAKLLTEFQRMLPEGKVKQVLVTSLAFQ